MSHDDTRTMPPAGYADPLRRERQSGLAGPLDRADADGRKNQEQDVAPAGGLAGNGGRTQTEAGAAGPSAPEGDDHQVERQRQSRGSRGPDEEPGFGQGA